MNIEEKLSIIREKFRKEHELQDVINTEIDKLLDMIDKFEIMQDNLFRNKKR